MVRFDNSLHEVDLNAQLGDEYKTLSHSLKRGVTHDNNCTHHLMHQYTVSNLSYAVSNLTVSDEGSSSEIETTLSNTYSYYYRIHGLRAINLITKQHLLLIVKLINGNCLNSASRNIISLYNNTNRNSISEIQQLLLCDYTKNNKEYLSSLKILVLQTLLKKHDVSESIISVIKLFAYDRKLLLEDHKLKKNTVIKLILNYYSKFKEYRLLFGLKFLQYIAQFNFRYDEFIKNMTRDAFLQQLGRQKTSNNTLTSRYLSMFYFSYQMQYKSNNDQLFSSTSAEHVPEGFFNLQNVVTNLERNERFFDKYMMSTKQLNDLINIITEEGRVFEKELDEKSILLIQRILSIFQIKCYEISKPVLKFLDKIIILLNSNVKYLSNDISPLIKLIESMIQFCTTNSLHKTFENTMAVAYNIALKTKNSELLLLVSKFEFSRLLLNYKETEKIKPSDLNKFNVFLSATKEIRYRYKILQIFYHHTLFDGKEHFNEVYAVCEYIAAIVKRKIGTLKWENLECKSEVMKGIIAGVINDRYPNNECMEPCILLLQSSFFPEKVLTSEEYNDSSNQDGIVYDVFPLLKCNYLLNNDIAKGRTMYLVQVTKTFCQFATKDNKVNYCSRIENDFIKKLLNYLSINGYHKLLLSVVGILEKRTEYYKTLSNDYITYKAHSCMRLKLKNRTKHVFDQFTNQKGEIKFDDEKDIYNHLIMSLLYASWEDSPELFTSSNERVPKDIKEHILDFSTNDKSNLNKYFQKLIFNIKFANYYASLLNQKKCYSYAVEVSKKGLKIGKSVLKIIEKLDLNDRLTVLNQLVSSYSNLIKIYTAVGLAKGAQYYCKEVTKLLPVFDQPIFLFSVHVLLFEFYLENGDYDSALTHKKNANYVFDNLNAEHDIISTTSFLYINEEYDKIQESLRLYFGYDLNDTDFFLSWKLKLGNICDECPTQYSNMNFFNKIVHINQRLVLEIDADPFLKSLNETILANLNCVSPGSLSNILDVGMISSNSTNRSSNMTPKRRPTSFKTNKHIVMDILDEFFTTFNAMRQELTERNVILKVSDIYRLNYFYLISLLSVPESRKQLIEETITQLNELPSEITHTYESLLADKNCDIYGKTIFELESSNYEIMKSKNVTLNWEEQIGKDRLLDLCNITVEVICIDICKLTNTLIIRRISNLDSKNIMAKIPIDRNISRDLDADSLTFQQASESLQKIINDSNESVSKNVTETIKDKNDVRNWWKRRYDLDELLGNLIERIEKTWLNGLSGILNGLYCDKDALLEFQSKITAILNQILPSRRNCCNRANFLQLDEWIISLLLDLDPSDLGFFTALEDVIYFILDTLSHKGEENAYDEIDFGLLHVLLEEEIRKVRVNKKFFTKIEHTFLVVGPSCHTFPWEIMKPLKGRSVTRVPSLTILSNLLSSIKGNLPVKIERTNDISMILNSNSDLVRTEKTFKDIFERIQDSRAGSRLLVNQKPTEEEYMDYLTNSKVFLYVGHGGGEQYVRNCTIERCDKLPPVFLMGCSSAATKLNGNLNPNCVAESYMYGNSVMVLGNLWDVTDKDIDKFSIEMLEKCNLLDAKPNTVITGVPQAVADSRTVCHLKYLNGAAPVVYGLPVVFI